MISLIIYTSWGWTAPADAGIRISADARAAILDCGAVGPLEEDVLPLLGLSVKLQRCCCFCRFFSFSLLPWISALRMRGSEQLTVSSSSTWSNPFEPVLSGPPTPSAVWLAIKSDCPLGFWSLSELCAARRLPSRDATWFGLVARTAASSSSSWRVLGRDWMGQQISRFLKPVLRTD